MDKDIKELVKKVIKEELGEMVSKELEIRFKPIQKQIDIIQESNDHISEQIKEDRKDINQIKIDTAKGITQNKVIIDNQNVAEDKMVEAVKVEAKKIPKNVEQSVEKIFDKKPFLIKLKERFK